jgi:hypothetical protein
MDCLECLRLAAEYKYVERAFESALDLVALSPLAATPREDRRLRDASDRAGIISEAALLVLNRHRQTRAHQN